MIHTCGSTLLCPACSDRSVSLLFPLHLHIRVKVLYFRIHDLKLDLFLPLLLLWRLEDGNPQNVQMSSLLFIVYNDHHDLTGRGSCLLTSIVAILMVLGTVTVKGSTGPPPPPLVAAPPASDSLCSRSLFFLFSSCEMKAHMFN